MHFNPKVNNAKKIALMLVGSLPPPYGGTSVSFKFLIDEMGKNNSVKIVLINTMGIRGKSLKNITKLLNALFKIAINAFRVDVLCPHLNDFPFAFLGLYILLIGKITCKPVIIRKFGGNPFNIGKFGNLAAILMMKYSNLCLLQTKMLINYARELGVKRIEWYPTSRPHPQNTLPQQFKKECNKYIYIGHIKKEKGIVELIEAAERLPKQISIDVYGPITYDISEKQFENKKQIKYCGIIEPEKVIETLYIYDALVLPTYSRKEGYAGAVIEAYFAGLPVICTLWQALPEIVDDNTGILIPPCDSDALYKALCLLSNDLDLFQRLRDGAIKKSKEFELEYWANQYLGYCKRLVT